MDVAAVIDQAQRAIEQASWLAYPLVFVGGALTGLNPCVYPTIPVILGYIGGQKDGARGARGMLLALAFVLGLAITYVLMGVTASFVGSVLGLSREGWFYVVAAVCILAGLHMTELLALPLPTVAARPSAAWAGSFVGAVLLGMLFGVVAAPCAMPIVAVLVAVIASSGKVLYGASLMFLYALGHGLPLVVIGAVAGALTSLAPVARYAGAIQRISGFLLILVGAWLIWVA
ncbi:MAG: cytochrome c biogenesis CcdA family protein [Armatimonadota bacterium]